MGGKIVLVDTKHAFGYHCPDKFGIVGTNPKFRKMLYLHDGLNAASVLLSPLAGIARIITAVVTYLNFNNKNQEKARIDLNAAKRFAIMQGVRGVLEVLCLGVIMGTVVDGIMTMKHNDMLCFRNT